MIKKQGTVVKISGTNTAKVEVHAYRAHQKYKKMYRVTKRYLVHDPKGETKVGQLVEIQPCRPVSKRKHWKLTTILKQAAV